MAQVAYKATISIISGTSIDTGIRGVGVTKLSDNTYQVTVKGKRHIDTNKPIRFVSFNLGLGVSIKVIDVPNGIFQFQGLGDVVIADEGLKFSFSYFNAAEILGANSYTVDLTGDILPDTTFNKARNNNGFMTNTYGINTVSITLSNFYEINTNVRQAKQDRQNVMIEIHPSSGNESIRGVFLTESINLSGDISSLESEEYTFQLAGDIDASFSWSSNNANIQPENTA